jgi:hypothetical protein
MSLFICQYMYSLYPLGLVSASIRLTQPYRVLQLMTHPAGAQILQPNAIMLGAN